MNLTNLFIHQFTHLVQFFAQFAAVFRTYQLDLLQSDTGSLKRLTQLLTQSTQIINTSTSVVAVELNC